MDIIWGRACGSLLRLPLVVVALPQANIEMETVPDE